MPKLFYYSTLAEGMRILCGRQASTHFIFIFCTTWLALIPSLVNFEQSSPKVESRNVNSFGLICIFQTIFNKSTWYPQRSYNTVLTWVFEFLFKGGGIHGLWNVSNVRKLKF